MNPHNCPGDCGCSSAPWHWCDRSVPARRSRPELYEVAVTTRKVSVPNAARSQNHRSARIPRYFTLKHAFDKLQVCQNLSIYEAAYHPGSVRFRMIVYTLAVQSPLLRIINQRDKILHRQMQRYAYHSDPMTVISLCEMRWKNGIYWRAKKNAWIRFTEILVVITVFVIITYTFLWHYARHEDLSLAAMGRKGPIGTGVSEFKTISWNRKTQKLDKFAICEAVHHPELLTFVRVFEVYSGIPYFANHNFVEHEASVCRSKRSRDQRTNDHMRYSWANKC